MMDDPVNLNDMAASIAALQNSFMVAMDRIEALEGRLVERAAQRIADLETTVLQHERRIAALEGGHASGCSFINNPGNGVLMPGEPCPDCGYRSPSVIVTSGGESTEITPAMIEAGRNAMQGFAPGRDDWREVVERIYRAMEAAKEK